GAEGPYRVTPNLMVVVPTSNHVHLHYEQRSIDFIANGLTLLGVALVIVLARMRPLRMPEPPEPTEDRLGRFLVGSRTDEFNVDGSDESNVDSSDGFNVDGSDEFNVDGSEATNGVMPSATLSGDRERPPEDP